MKPMSLLACGIVRFIDGRDRRSRSSGRKPGRLAAESQGHGRQAWQQKRDAQPRVQPPAPRGDLRGDIASNVRARPEPPRETDPP